MDFIERLFSDIAPSGPLEEGQGDCLRLGDTLTPTLFRSRESGTAAASLRLCR
jgi:hypothetical protein